MQFLSTPNTNDAEQLQSRGALRRLSSDQLFVMYKLICSLCPRQSLCPHKGSESQSIPNNSSLLTIGFFGSIRFILTIHFVRHASPIPSFLPSLGRTAGRCFVCNIVQRVPRAIEFRCSKSYEGCEVPGDPATKSMGLNQQIESDYWDDGT